MSNFDFQNPETLLLHAGQQVDPATNSRAVPIYQTTSYVFNNAEHAQNLFGLAEPGNIYSRIMNPTVGAFEERMATLEDGVGALAFSSGMAAITFSILNIAEAGDEIIADSNLYGGTYNLFANTLPRYGVNVKFVDGTDPEAVRNAITDKTKAIFGEIITNPSLNIFDVETIADIAHENGVPLIIDSTFATPYGSKPITWGADIVVHSATKWIGGHGTTIGGVVIDGGRFDWGNGRFPGFTEPDESYGGLKFVDVGPAAYITKLRVQLLRDIGACLSPQNAFLFLQGLETLHLRIKRHTENAQVVAEYLDNHPAVEWVNFPGLESHPSHEKAKKYFKEGFGSVITFGIKGGREAGRKVIDNIKLWSHVANVGDAKSLIIHPASTTHQQLSAEDLKKSGTPEELIRLSIGLESTDDIIRELDKAISIATGNAPTIQTTEENAITWLLSSPFDRSEGLRKKIIATTNAASDAAVKLGKLGYQIVSLEDGKDIPNDIDALWLKDGNLSASAVEQLSEKQVKILWVENSQETEATEKAKSNGISVILGKDPLEEANRLRGRVEKEKTFA